MKRQRRLNCTKMFEITDYSDRGMSRWKSYKYACSGSCLIEAKLFELYKPETNRCCGDGSDHSDLPDCGELDHCPGDASGEGVGKPPAGWCSWCWLPARGGDVVSAALWWDIGVGYWNCKSGCWQHCPLSIVCCWLCNIACMWIGDSGWLLRPVLTATGGPDNELMSLGGLDCATDSGDQPQDNARLLASVQ